MWSTSKPPVLGEREQPRQRVLPSQRSGEYGLELEETTYFTGDDEFWHPAVSQGFDPDLWLPLFGSKVEDDEFHWHTEPVMNTPKSLSPESDILPDFPIPTMPGHGYDTDIVNHPQNMSQTHHSTKREIEDNAAIGSNNLANSRKRSGTEAFSTEPTIVDSMRPRQAAKIDTDNEEKTRTQFACPYQKKDSFRHHACLKYDLRRIKDVKQHVYRRHKQPDFYCAVCFDTFKNADARDKHLRTKECDDKTDPGFEGITDAQKKELNKSPSRGLLPEEQWYRMWDIIFPGEARPNSVGVGTYMDEMVPLLRSLWAMKSPDILAKARRTQTVPVSCDLLNRVMESIFDELEVEASASLKVGKPAHATCFQSPNNLNGWQLQPAITPSRFINESQEPLFDEPHGIFQELKGDAGTEFEAIVLRAN